MGHTVAEFHHGDIHLLGFSLAGEETFIVAPEMNLAFDVGRAPREVINVDHVFLSHGHTDHSAGLVYYCAQRLFLDHEPGHVYLAAPLIDPLRQILRLWAEIDGQEPPINLHPVTPGTDIPLRRDLVIRPFEVAHTSRQRRGGRVPALGFACIDVRKKLKPEYHGLDGPELVKLKEHGTEITATIEVPLVAYCGDTAVGPFLDLPFVRDAQVLLLECTFVDPDHVDRARAGNHMHLDDLAAIYPRLNNEKIVLVHLSRRTALAEARERVRAALPADAVGRVSFLMDHRRRRGGRRPASP